MKPETIDLLVVADRLEKLETENRKLKRAALLALSSLGAVLLMGQTASRSTTIEAETFVLKDSLGRTRAEITLLPAGPTLRFFDESGNVASLLSGKGISFFSANAARVKIEGEDRTVEVASATLHGSGLWFDDAEGKTIVSLGSTKVGEPPTPSLRLSGPQSSDRPNVELIDAGGFVSILGKARLNTIRTGEASTTSAASLVMFGKDGKVIWRAP